MTLHDLLLLESDRFNERPHILEGLFYKDEVCVFNAKKVYKYNASLRKHYDETFEFVGAFKAYVYDYNDVESEHCVGYFNSEDECRAALIEYYKEKKGEKPC